MQRESGGFKGRYKIIDEKILNCLSREQNPRLLRRPTRCLTAVPTELSMAYHTELQIPVKFNGYDFIPLFYYYI